MTILMKGKTMKKGIRKKINRVVKEALKSKDTEIRLQGAILALQLENADNGHLPAGDHQGAVDQFVDALLPGCPLCGSAL